MELKSTPERASEATPEEAPTTDTSTEEASGWCCGIFPASEDRHGLQQYLKAFPSPSDRFDRFGVVAGLGWGVDFD